MYEQLQFRVSRSLICQLEGSAAVSSTFPRQQEAFEFADQIQVFRSRQRSNNRPEPHLFHPTAAHEKTPRVFSFESANGGKRRFLVTSMDAFWDSYSKTLPGQRHVYEIIRECVPCRLYFDLGMNTGFPVIESRSLTLTTTIAEFKTNFNPTVNGDELVVRLIALVQLQLYVRQCVFSLLPHKEFMQSLCVETAPLSSPRSPRSDRSARFLNVR